MGVGANVFERRLDSACCTLEGSHRCILHTFLISAFVKMSGQVYALASLPSGQGPLVRRVGVPELVFKGKILAPVRN
jgi:hypothetical protein